MKYVCSDLTSRSVTFDLSVGEIRSDCYTWLGIMKGKETDDWVSLSDSITTWTRWEGLSDGTHPVWTGAETAGSNDGGRSVDHLRLRSAGFIVDTRGEQAPRRWFLQGRFTFHLHYTQHLLYRIRWCFLFHRFFTFCRWLWHWAVHIGS